MYGEKFGRIHCYPQFIFYKLENSVQKYDAKTFKILSKVLGSAIFEE